MSDDTMRSRNRLVFWLVLVICLAPLIPYAMRGTPEQAAAQLGSQATDQPAVTAAITPS